MSRQVIYRRHSILVYQKSDLSLSLDEVLFELFGEVHFLPWRQLLPWSFSVNGEDTFDHLAEISIYGRIILLYI